MESVLITRPDKPGRALTAHLNQLGICAQHFPLIAIQARDLAEPLEPALHRADIIIAVSQYAVHFSAPHIQQWPASCEYLAVGTSTAKQLARVCHCSVTTPDIHDSEHLLALANLSQSQVSGKNIIILRGNGGRELLFQQLASRGAVVEYREVYQRKLLYFDAELTITEWKDNQIQHVVITSTEQLNHLLSMCKGHKVWLQQRHLYVPSERIATQASQLGFRSVTCTHGASNSVISRALQAQIKENDND